MRGLGTALQRQARWPEAEAALLQAVEMARQSPGWYFAPRRAAVVALIDLYDQWHAAEPAAGHDQAVAEWRAKLAEFDTWMDPPEQAPATTSP